MKKIITYGTFDFFHYGHFMLLKRAKEFGDYLMVGLSSDEFNLTKNKKSILNFTQRKDVLCSIRFIDSIIIEESWEQKIEDIKKYEIDILVMGSDWKGKFDHLQDHCEIIYIERTPKISTTLIKKLL